MKPVGFEAAETHFRPSLGRGALALAIVLYGFARFGLAAGGRIAVAAAIFGLLEAAQMSVRSRWLKALLIASQFALIVAVALAPAPLGFGSTIPGPMMLQTPLLLLMFCLLASYASSIDAILMAVAGIALVLCWFAGVAFVQADPRTLTRASLHMKDYHTPLELMRAVNQPHYLQTDPRKEELRAGVVIGAILCFGALRVSRLARQSAQREAARRALTTYFSPQLIDMLTTADIGLPPERRRVAVLDADLVRFSSHAERLAPETVAEVLALYREAAAEAIFSHGGAILNFAGDGLIAVFGLVEAYGEAASTGAMLAAETLLRRWRALSPPEGMAHLPDLAVGIDAGAALVGVVGEGRAMSLLMQGPPIVRAAELQAATRTLGSPILLSEAAAAAASGPAKARLTLVEGAEGVWALNPHG